jgi:hypothetical protein
LSSEKEEFNEDNFLAAVIDALIKGQINDNMENKAVTSAIKERLWVL